MNASKGMSVIFEDNKLTLECLERLHCSPIYTYNYTTNGSFCTKKASCMSILKALYKVTNFEN